MSRSPRSLLLAASAMLATLALAAGGSAAHAAEMVVIATTAPTVAAGEVVHGGTPLDLPPGAVVTLLGADGRSVTVTGPGGVVPGDGGLPQSASAGSVLDALGALVGAGARTEGTAIAAVRAVTDCHAVAAAAAGQSDLERIAGLVRQGCTEQARAELAALSASTVPPSLYLGTLPDGVTVFRIGDRFDLQLQTNFNAHVYCYYHQADGSVVPIFPADGGNGQVWANRPYRVLDDLQFSHPTGSETVRCFATDRDVSAELPAALVGRPYEPLPADLAARLPQIFAGLGNVRHADASVDITVTQ